MKERPDIKSQLKFLAFHSNKRFEDINVGMSSGHLESPHTNKLQYFSKQSNPSREAALGFGAQSSQSGGNAAAPHNSLLFPNFLVIQDEPSGNLVALSVPEGIPTHFLKQELPKERKIGKISTPKYKENREFPKDREFLCDFYWDLCICSLWEAGGKREHLLDICELFGRHKLRFSWEFPLLAHLIRWQDWFSWWNN